MKFLLGTTAYNNHLQNIALALYESDYLGAYYTAFADNYSYPVSRNIRNIIQKQFPNLDRQLNRRKITAQIPDELIYKNWPWEIIRTLACKIKLDDKIIDWIFDRGEFDLENKCCDWLKSEQFDSFFGVEYGALAALKTAKNLGKTSIVGFLSPHYSFRQKWVDSEYQKFPELLTNNTKFLLKLGKSRDQRKDEEAEIADFIHTGSSVTENSLVAAGFSREKMITVPLGSPPSIFETSLPDSLSSPLKFIYAGGISVHKGVHYLLKAWQLLNPNNAELHLYGKQLLPEKLLTNLPKNIIFHGSVPQQDLLLAYQQSAILVFPTLCDGFGMVISEALANGLPVITTKNAGGCDLIDEGKNGFIVPPADSKVLAEKIEWCLQNPQKLLAMRPYALETAKNWTWNDFRVSLRKKITEKLL
jgi:glycosyltransferase involved in cell wall biosynthesis